MRVVDLFCGCGGMTLGFEQAGFEVVAGFDNWEPAVAIYEANFEHPIFTEDISEDHFLSNLGMLEPDVIVGGPPCQDYSIAGKRQLGERANLTIRFSEVVSSIRPQWVVFENVYNIERYPTLPKMKQILTNSGYGLTTQVLDASRCGVPQKRHRFFLIGKLGEADGFLEHQLLSKLSQRQMTVRDYLGNSLGTDFYYMHPRSYQRRAVFSVDEPAATIRGINRPIPENYERHHGDPAHISDGVRALTTRERARLQTFPAHFNLPGSKTVVELAIGNAVPPALARYVAEGIGAYSNSLALTGNGAHNDIF